MRKQLISFVVLFNLCFAYSAFATNNVDYRQTWIYTNDTSDAPVGYDYAVNCGTRCFQPVNILAGDYITRSQASVNKYNPTTAFNNSVWKEGDSETVVGGITFMGTDGKRVYQSYVNYDDYGLPTCANTTYLKFQYQYTSGGYWYTWKFAVYPGC